MEFEIKSGDQVEGIISTVRDVDIREAYSDLVEKFTKDNSFMGEEWHKKVLELLSIFPTDDGCIRGSNSYANTFIAQIGVPLVALEKLRQAYKQNNNQNPFTGQIESWFLFGIETGLALIPDKYLGKYLGGEYRLNKELAERLVSDLKARDIEIGHGKVLNFTQLKIIANKDLGLVFTLNEKVEKNNVPDLNYPDWNHVSSGGLFRTGLKDGLSLGWWAGNFHLYTRDWRSRIVRYDSKVSK